MNESNTPPTPEFIWQMRQQIRTLRSVWSQFPSGKDNCSTSQHLHYQNVSSMIDMIALNVEFANDELRKQ